MPTIPTPSTADGIAVYASPVFASAAQGGTPGFVNAWGAALAYTFQIISISPAIPTWRSLRVQARRALAQAV